MNGRTNRENWYRASWPECPAWPRLNGHLEAEVVIVGGGLAGLNTALALVERGLSDVAVLEAGQLAHGASGRNGGFVFSGYSLGPEALVRQVGEARAREMLGWTVQAVGRIRQRARLYGIDCELTEGGVIWGDWFHDRKALLARRDWLRKAVGLEWEFIDRSRLGRMVDTRRYGDALLEREAFHYNPLRYAQGLARAVQAAGGAIRENSPVLGIQRDSGKNSWTVRTPLGTVSARQLVLAGGAYGPAVQPVLRRAVLPIRTYVMSTEPLGDRVHDLIRGPWAIYDTRFAFDYYRKLPDSRLLWGGRISVREPDEATIVRWLKRDLLKVFPQLEDVAVERGWSGKMSYTRHQMPLVGELAPGLFSATGFGGHGMAPTTVAGEVLAEAMTGDSRRLEAFSRWKPVLAGGVLGQAAAQLTYWALQSADAWKSRPGAKTT